GRPGTGPTRSYGESSVNWDIRETRYSLLAVDELVRRALQRPTRLRPPQHDLFNLPRQGEILVGDAAGRVGLELDDHPPPGDGQVGVVVGGLAQVADSVDEHQRRRPAVRVVLAADPTVLQKPVAQAALLELRRDVRVGVDLWLVAHGNGP